MYSVSDYARMVADRARTQAYAEALRRTVTKESVVLDVGTGTGFAAVLAAKFGAKKVIAVEPSDVIYLAREVAKENGVDDRVRFFHGPLRDMDLEEKVDVVVSDLRGKHPFFEGYLSTLAHARTFLAPHGVMMPLRDTFWVSVVHAPVLYDSMFGAWENNPFGLAQGSVRRAATHDIVDDARAPIQANAQLSEPKPWSVLDYQAGISFGIAGGVSLGVSHEGLGHGLCVWFDAALTSEVGFSNRPGETLVYGRLFFPWPEPVMLSRGDHVEVALSANTSEFDVAWGWRTRITSREPRTFTQSTFFAMPTPKQDLLSRSSPPTRTRESQAIERVLGWFNGVRTWEVLAADLRAEFPDLFATEDGALRFVRGVGGRLGKKGRWV